MHCYGGYCNCSKRLHENDERKDQISELKISHRLELEE